MADGRKSIEMVEVSPRDGLQNEDRLFSTEEKVELITRAIDAGVKRLEVASFVHPKRVPQMADAEAVLTALPERPDVTYIGLVLNKRGVLRALDTAVDEMGAVCLVSDTFAQKNQGQTAQESVDVSKEIIQLAKAEGRSVQVTISAAFGCPFEGEMSSQRVVDFACQLAEVEPREIALADTIGVAVPGQITDLVGRLKQAVPAVPLRVHFHNTRNTGLSNVWAAVEAGATTVDASIAGIGGCPFAPAATGNVPTEDVVYLLERSGVDTSLDLDGLIDAAKWLTKKMERPLPGMVSRAGTFPPHQEIAAE
jgi:hydroxymethylglutaryl-CoA lyase